MKKHLLLIFILFLHFLPTKAQYVAIPDANFLNWLQLHYPTCMNGNLMDTTCTDIVNETIVDVSFKHIQDLSGIEYFDSLDSLNCSNDSLTSIIHLPHSLRSLVCSSNFITAISALPDSLQYFKCSGNYTLANLPNLPAGLKTLICGYTIISALSSLPNTLIHLDCQYNLISSYPSLPNGLKYFYYGRQTTSNFPIPIPALPSGLLELTIQGDVLVNNDVPTLPLTLKNLKIYSCPINNPFPAFPPTLRYFTCNNCQLTSIPSLPSTMFDLEVPYNSLTVIPPLPNGLGGLRVAYNQLTSLPTLPNTLQLLICSNNLLTTIAPSLPSGFWSLDCNDNLLTSLPTLPNFLQTLRCYNNNISCFPVFGTNLVNPNKFNISNNPFTCVPNYIPAMNAATLAMPLCQNNDTINNPNACIGARGIVGKTYFDTNSNCYEDSLDTNVKYVSLKLYNSNNAFVGYTYSAINGIYQFYTTPGTYKVSIDTAFTPYKVNCLNPGIDSIVTVTSGNQLIENINFEVDCKSGYDVGTISAATSCLVFPGEQHFLKLFSGDISQFFGMNCAAGLSGQVVLNLTGPYTYISPFPGALTPSVSGSTFTYNISDFGNIDNMNAFGLLLQTDTLAQGGDFICGNVVVSPTSGDNNLWNNNVNFCYAVSNSYDPNNKEVYPTDVLPGYNDWFNYTIHFQNTGTAPAINISIVDTLNANLDLSTFEFLTSSHPSTVQLTGNRVKFRFANIMLPDSSSDLFGSQGFVQYRIKPNANLPLGTQIKNTAHIYFDFNPAIVTNTTINNFTTLVTKTQPTVFNDQTVILYPNPSNGIFNFKDTKNLKQVEVYNLLGEQILAQGNQKQINLSGFSKGIYYARINGEMVVKLVKD